MMTTMQPTDAWPLTEEAKELLRHIQTVLEDAKAEIEQLSDDLLKAQEALQRASDWLHAAYDRPPRTPDCQAMLDEIDALCGLGAEKSGWSAPHDDESN